MNISEIESLVLQHGRQIAALEAEIAALKANSRLGKFAQAPAAAPASPPPQPEGARIYHPITRATIALPSEGELEKMLDVVVAKYPKLRPYSASDRFAAQDHANYLREFSSAFSYIAMRGRSTEVDTTRGVTWWAAEASEWNRQRNMPIDIGVGPFLAAVVAAGDIDFIESDMFGNVWSFALTPYSAGRPAQESWRDVLRGQLRKPLPGKHKPLSADERPSVRLEGTR